MDELEAEAAAVLEAAVAHLSETSYTITNVYFDDRTQALARQKLSEQGFTSRDEVVQFYKASPPALHDLVKATCTQHTDRIIAELGILAATSRDLQQPSRWRREGDQAYADRMEAQRHAAAIATERELKATKGHYRAPAPGEEPATNRLLKATEGTALEAAAKEARPTEDPDEVVIPGEAVCDFEVVWRELCMVYTDAPDEATLTRVAQIVMPHLFRACTRTITDLAIYGRHNNHEPLIELLDDVAAHVPKLCCPSVQRVLHQLDAATYTEKTDEAAAPHVEA